MRGDFPDSGHFQSGNIVDDQVDSLTGIEGVLFGTMLVQQAGTQDGRVFLFPHGPSEKDLLLHSVGRPGDQQIVEIDGQGGAKTLAIGRQARGQVADVAGRRDAVQIQTNSHVHGRLKIVPLIQLKLRVRKFGCRPRGRE